MNFKGSCIEARVLPLGCARRNYPDAGVQLHLTNAKVASVLNPAAFVQSPKMRAFITGGSGFIGRCLIAELVRRGDDVYALARSDAGAETVAKLGMRTAGQTGVQDLWNVNLLTM